MNASILWRVLTMGAFILTLAVSFSSPVAAQGDCDPTFELCDDFDDLPPLDEPILDEPWSCEADPFCDPEFFEEDPFIDCDPQIDLGCPQFEDDPLFPPLDEPFCDPYFDPACGPATTIVGDDPFACDPVLDPTCLGEPPADFVEYCNEVPDPLCDILDDAPTAPPAVAFSDAAGRAGLVAVTRADRSDDIPASEVPVKDIPAITANRLVLVVDALAELGAFQRTPDPALTGALRQLREDIPADGLSEEGYRDEVRRLAADLPIYIAQLDAANVEVSAALRSLPRQLTDEALDALDAGDTTLFDAAPMFSSIADLLARGGGGPDDGRDLREDITEVLGLSVLFAVAENPTPTTTIPTTTTVVTTTVAPTTTVAQSMQLAVEIEPAEGSPGTSTGVWVGIGAAILLGALALFAVLRRSRADESASSGGNELVSVDDLLDASRRMTATLDASEIVSIALAEAHRFIDAEGGIVVMRDDGELKTVGVEPAHFFLPERAHEGALRRVVETGRSIVTIVTDEPVLVEVPVAMVAVSIVIDGTVAGSIMAVRIPSRPFDRHELEALEMLAPLVGSALHAAAAHDTATALVDVEPMTGLKNRRRLDRDMAEISDDDQVAYVMVDIDHFKNFNDVNGHAAGDDALCQTADAIAASVRAEDIVYRYGGEEFCILLPATTTEEAAVIAERARAAVEGLDIPGAENQPGGRVTISVGVADTSVGSIDDLIERADGALYDAKHGGRNRVCVEASGSVE